MLLHTYILMFEDESIYHRSHIDHHVTTFDSHVQSELSADVFRILVSNTNKFVGIKSLLKQYYIKKTRYEVEKNNIIIDKGSYHTHQKPYYAKELELVYNNEKIDLSTQLDRYIREYISRPKDMRSEWDCHNVSGYRKHRNKLHPTLLDRSIKDVKPGTLLSFHINDEPDRSSCKHSGIYLDKELIVSGRRYVENNLFGTAQRDVQIIFQDMKQVMNERNTKYVFAYDNGQDIFDRSQNLG